MKYAVGEIVLVATLIALQIKIGMKQESKIYRELKIAHQIYRKYNMKLFLTLVITLFMYPGMSLAQGFDYTPYGREFPVLSKIVGGRCMDVVVEANHLFVIGKSALYSFDISTPEAPVLLDSITGLGNVRQIEVEDGFAFVTCRQDGLNIIKVNDPNQLELVSHYDAIESATGVAVSGNVVAITNRIYGIELVDVSDPYNPRYLSQVLTDEAQSVYIWGQYAYVGDWASRKVITIDISDPENPKILSDVPVDGFPDGIFRVGDLCFVATGHHGMQLINKDASDPAWGKGHGLEIVDVSHPRHPKLISRLKLPTFYLRSPDWWDVQAAGQYVLLGDTKAGLFIIDAKDAYSPRFIGYARLPTEEGINESTPINGFALGQDVIYVAGMDGLYIVGATDIAVPVVKEPGLFEHYKGSSHRPDKSTYFTGTQVHAVAMDTLDQSVLVAAGSGGIHRVVMHPAPSGRQILDLDHEVYDICLVGDRLFVAEGLHGLSVWEYNSGEIGKSIGRYQSPGRGIYQVVVDAGSDIAALCANNTVEFVNISHPAHMEKIFEDRNPHLTYKNPIPNQVFDGRYFGGMWLGDCYLYEIQDGRQIQKIGEIFHSIGDWNVSFGPIHGFVYREDKAYAVFGDGLRIKDLSTKNDQEAKPIYFKDMVLSGKPTLSGSRLFCSDRRSGMISAVDISNPNAPQDLWQRKIDGNPGFIATSGDILVIPGGNGGVHFLRAADGQSYFKN